MVRPYELWGIAEVCGVSREFFTEEELWTATTAVHGGVFERLERIETAVLALVEQLGTPKGTK